jgi:hypothetical protein
VPHSGTRLVPAYLVFFLIRVLKGLASFSFCSFCTEYVHFQVHAYVQVHTQAPRSSTFVHVHENMNMNMSLCTWMEKDMDMDMVTTQTWELHEYKQ